MSHTTNVSKVVFAREDAAGLRRLFPRAAGDDVFVTRAAVWLSCPPELVRLVLSTATAWTDAQLQTLQVYFELSAVAEEEEEPPTPGIVAEECLRRAVYYTTQDPQPDVASVKRQVERVLEKLPQSSSFSAEGVAVASPDDALEARVAAASKKRPRGSGRATVRLARKKAAAEEALRVVEQEADELAGGDGARVSLDRPCSQDTETRSCDEIAIARLGGDGLATQEAYYLAAEHGGYDDFKRYGIHPSLANWRIPAPPKPDDFIQSQVKRFARAQN